MNLLSRRSGRSISLSRAALGVSVAVLCAVLFPYLADRVLRPHHMQGRTRSHMVDIKGACDVYFEVLGRHPKAKTTVQLLELLSSPMGEHEPAALSLGGKPPADAARDEWGSMMVVVARDEDGAVVLQSVGPDRALGTRDDIAQVLWIPGSGGRRTQRERARRPCGTGGPSG